MGNVERIARLATATAYDVIWTLEGTLKWINNIGQECGEDVLQKQLPDGFKGRFELRRIIDNQRGLERQKARNVRRTTRWIAAATDTHTDVHMALPDGAASCGSGGPTEPDVNLVTCPECLKLLGSPRRTKDDVEKARGRTYTSTNGNARKIAHRIAVTSIRVVEHMPYLRERDR